VETTSRVETRGAEEQKIESIAYLEPIDDLELPTTAFSVDPVASPPSSRSVSFPILAPLRSAPNPYTPVEGPVDSIVYVYDIVWTWSNFFISPTSSLSIESTSL